MKAIFVLIFTLGFSCAVSAAKPEYSLYLEGSQSAALILCHGRGKHPGWKVVDPLRKDVHEKMNWHTLSIQMPAEDKSWESYADDFPAAYLAIQSAIKFLTEEKKVKDIYLMGHSMGARMVSAYIAEQHSLPIKGVIIAGCRNNGDYPLDCKRTISKVPLPVFDIWGGSSEKDTDAASERAELVSEKYQQASIANANHKFDDHESEFTSAVINWLKQQ